MRSGKLFENFSRPSVITDYHLFLFLIQFAVMLISVLLCIKLVLNLEEDKPSQGTGVEKHFMKLPTLDSDEESVLTDQFIDLERGGVWLTDRQEVIFTGYLLGAFFAGVILVFVGVGPIYNWVRHIIAVITLGIVPYVIFIVSIGLWLVAVCFILFVMGILNMFFAPFILLLHLTLGMIQIVRKRG